MQYLKHIEENGEYIHSWNQVSINDSVRIYYKQSGSLGFGFSFYAVEYCSNLAGVDTWDIDELEVDIVVHGIASWDEIRHMYFGDEGYTYCLNLDDLILVSQALKELQNKYCQEKYENRV